MLIQRPPFVIHHFASLGSTNDQLKQMADVPEFTCVVADEQTAGRGRYARQWYSAPGEGLYLSVLLRPSASAQLPLLSLMAAIAVAETLLARGVTGADIKWPNDVLIDNRKLCGILIEAASAGREAARLILGIGVNLNQQSFPPELSDTATSLQIATGHVTAVDQFRDQLLARLAEWYERWQRAPQTIIARWQALSSYARGQQVIVTLANEQLTGVTEGLTESGALRLRTTDGAVKIILAGEVTRLRKEAVTEQ
jgi:BirA family transcriptional regulator, biotin operon repressor / biotin---[acetyl-CoA-carboxylase] ligase